VTHSRSVNSDSADHVLTVVIMIIITTSSQTRYTLVHIVEGLKVRQMHHGEERLLERVMDCLRRCQHLIEALLYQLRNFERVEGGLFNADRNAPQASGRRLIRQEVLRQNPVEVENRIAVQLLMNVTNSVLLTLMNKPRTSTRPSEQRKLCRCF
jgi:hypothetical protein